MTPRFAPLLALPLLFAAAPASAQSVCPAPSIAIPAAGALPTTQGKLRARQPVRILAIGSSTTAGVGGGGAGYANQLGPMIRARAGGPVEVIVSGVLGETAIGAVARLTSEVASQRPDLVVWQLGTNDANFGVTEQAFRAAVAQGVSQVRARGVEIVLVDPQFSRWAGDGEVTARKAAIIAQEGGARGAVVVRRYAAMRDLARANRAVFDSLIAWDGLHLTPAGHTCLAQQVAGTIARGVR